MGWRGVATALFIRPSSLKMLAEALAHPCLKLMNITIDLHRFPVWTDPKPHAYLGEYESTSDALFRLHGLSQSPSSLQPWTLKLLT